MEHTITAEFHMISLIIVILEGLNKLQTFKISKCLRAANLFLTANKGIHSIFPCTVRLQILWLKYYIWNTCDLMQIYRSRKGEVSILYSRKFLRTINFAVFMDFTSTTKNISSKVLPEQAACLCNQIDCFTHVVTWYVVVQVLCSKMQGSLPNYSWTVIFIIVIILPLLQPMEKSLK